MPSLNIERDQTICRLYTEGKTSTELAEQFRLTRSRVYEIIKTGGVLQRLSKTRGEFLGVNLTEAVKKSLKDEAVKRGLSMSNLTSRTLVDMLTALGYKIVDDHGQTVAVKEQG